MKLSTFYPQKQIKITSNAMQSIKSILIILFRMDTQFGVPVINILWTIVAGKRFRSEDPQVQRMMILLNRLG